MIRLHPTRFAAIVCQKLPNRVILICPALLPLIGNNSHLEDIILTPAPKNSDNGKIVAHAELFDPSWKSKHVGSARNLVLNGVQLKGVGVVLPVVETYPEGAGNFSTAKAIREFLYIHLADTSLPLGAARAIGVCQRREKSELSVLVREYSTPRLTSIGSEMTAEEKNTIKEHLEIKFPDSTPDEILRQVCAAQASMALLAEVGNGTPDNILLDGAAIDLESWTWPDDGEGIRLFADFKCPGAGSAKTIENFDWKNASLYYDSWSVYEHALKNSLKAYKYIFGDEIKTSLNELLKIFYLNLKSLAGGDIGPWNYRPQSPFKEWIKELKAKGCSLKLDLIPESETYSLHIQWKSKDQSSPTETEMIIHKYLAITTEDAAVDPVMISNQLLEFAGRHGIVLKTKPDKAGRPVPNVISVKEYWERSQVKWNCLSGESFELIVKMGNEEVSLKRDDLIDSDAVPLFFRGEKEGQKIIIPADKVIIKSR